MKKVNNFKMYFSKKLGEKYNLNHDEISEYWANKESKEHYGNTKGLIASIGAGGLVGTTGFLVYDVMNGADCIIPVCIVGGISVLTTAVSLVKRNPYKDREYKEIDEDYKKTKKAYKKRMKQMKKRK